MEEKKRLEIAAKIAEELKKGEVTPGAIKGFKELMIDSGALPQEAIRQSPHFGITALPDDDW
ncbi:MAG: hypothetical protein PHQ47_00920 [Candidatus Portnoybacteria bacterium]|nr:hypothetical protein [Candidatus Portnoybacteria bacterium]